LHKPAELIVEELVLVVVSFAFDSLVLFASTTFVNFLLLFSSSLTVVASFFLRFFDAASLLGENVLLVSVDMPGVDNINADDCIRALFCSSEIEWLEGERLILKKSSAFIRFSCSLGIANLGIGGEADSIAFEVDEADDEADADEPGIERDEEPFLIAFNEAI
jgi:hypothetical protein